MTETIGIDSGPVNIAYTTSTNQPKSFHAQIGVAVSTNDYSKFREKCSTAITNSFSRFGLKRERDIYCNYDFNKIFNNTRFPIHQEFFKHIHSAIDDINIIFTTFGKDTKMNVFGKLSREKRIKLAKSEMNFKEILDNLHNYFPIVCAWRLNKMIRTNKSEVLLDSFTPTDFDGMRHLADLPISVHFSGDKCNPLIATADLLIQLISLRLSRNRLWYNREGLKQIFPEIGNKQRVHMIRDHDFKFISPVSRGANIDRILKHPIIFVFREANPYVSSDMLKNDDNFSPIFDFAFDKGGVVKFYSVDEDSRRIQDNDYIVYLTEGGKRGAESLLGIGKKLKIMSFKDIKSKY